MMLSTYDNGDVLIKGKMGDYGLDVTFAPDGQYKSGQLSKCRTPTNPPVFLPKKNRRRRKPTLPGSILHLWLKRMRIVPKGDCNCHKIIKAMDTLGPDLCWDIRHQIAKWMMEEADRRGIPAPWFVVVKVVERAIVTSKKRLKAGSIIS